jgi:transcriptional regulator with XRE-family HTH domain
MGRDYKTLKSKATRLRRKGLSYNEIRKKIGVSKSTLSLWLKSVQLTEIQRNRLYTKQVEILNRGPRSQKERREREVNEIIRRAIAEIKRPLSFETHRLMGAALYWAEGSKGKRFSITNSDPYLILFMVDWIEKIFEISPRTLKARLNIYPQQNDNEIKRFWSQLIGIPLENFGKSYVKPPNKNYKKNNLYYGTIKVDIPKSTDLLYRVFAWTKAVLKNIDPKVELVQRDWKHLKEIKRPVNLE